MTDPADRQATATEVFRRLTESPEQRRERAIQEFMAEHGFDSLACRTPDGRTVTYLSHAARERETKQRALELRLFQIQERLELDRQLTETKKAAHEHARDARESLLGPRGVWDAILGSRIA